MQQPTKSKSPLGARAAANIQSPSHAELVCSGVQHELTAGLHRLSENEIDAIISHIERCVVCQPYLNNLCPDEWSGVEPKEALDRCLLKDIGDRFDSEMSRKRAASLPPMDYTELVREVQTLREA